MISSLRLLASSALLLLAGTAAQAQERLHSPDLPGYVAAYDAANATQSILEEVPAGQSITAWTAMVTTQRFAMDQVSLDVFADAFLGGLLQSCPRASHSQPERFSHFGVPAMIFTAACPNSPATGRSEEMTVLALAGQGALHVKQVAFRAGYAGDTGWADGFLRATRLCDGICR